MKKLKPKDHYVQQKYLSNFSKDKSKKKIVCYDFQVKQLRSKQNITDCAHENGFLNFDIKEYLDLIEKENIRMNKEYLKDLAELFLSNPRFMDNFLTYEVEPFLRDINSMAAILSPL